MIEPVGSALWQWDTGRSVTLPEGATEAHYARAGDEEAVRVEAEDGVARVPDSLLQSDVAIACWAWDGAGTIDCARLVPLPRAKPALYVAGDDDVATVESIAADVVAAVLASAGYVTADALAEAGYVTADELEDADYVRHDEVEPLDDDDVAAAWTGEGDA